jgi:N-methylhydantoinase A/oxoprolinase/acetone carboxylase beta subunit
VIASEKPFEEKSQNSTVRKYEASAYRHFQSCFEEKWQSIPFFERDRLGAGARLQGPALIGEQYSMTIVSSGWQARIDTRGSIILKENRSFTADV